MICPHATHYGTGDMRTCANPSCAVWLVPDPEPLPDTPLTRLLRAVTAKGGRWVTLKGSKETA